MAKSIQPMDMNPFLEEFVSMCKKSRTTDGDRQRDGYGIAWLDENNTWQMRKSLMPIWENEPELIPETKMLIAHARSASFPNQKGKIEYNQPYVSGNYCFVFNGMLRGVKFGKLIEGKIGAQKIWNLISEQLDKGDSHIEALTTIQDLLHKKSSSIRGLNIGLCDGSQIAALCDYSEDQDYFTLHYSEDKDLKIICSERIGHFEWKSMSAGETKVL